MSAYCIATTKEKEQEEAYSHANEKQSFKE